MENQWIDEILEKSSPVAPKDPEEAELAKLLVDTCYAHKDLYPNGFGRVLDEVRKSEQAFKTSVSSHRNWKEKSGSLQEQSKQLFELARECAGTEYGEFLNVAEEASSLVSELSGKPIDESTMKPSLPPVYS